MKSTLKQGCDDDALEEEPAINVDYLSHAWIEEDIWATRRYLLKEKSALKNGIRLENALWRTWTKHQQQLNTLSPESVSWAKDNDITWLYGPWKPIEPSLVQTTYQSSQLSSSIRSVLKRRTLLSFTSCIQLIPNRSLNEPLVLENDILKLGGARAWLRLLSCVGASAARHTNEWFRRIWPPLPSTNRTKVHFDL
ncbi:hypothetical protein N7510_002323 [Penicillium lagena]|uniref:uncharacterized protein n=1 Tax=Penicillium lagena TaxID=94218 RepID=UPI002541B888|nr:uncharacterized protein N7510_002323 [Penicillium lagena]KAJ5626014.1 hypothetical protein N7510_002323 [Penicillium lagena]